MKRHELEHIIRAVSGNTNKDQFYIFGSQSILGKHPNAPEPLLVSLEADVAAVDVEDQDAIATLIDGSIGELSLFHETFGYYAHGVTEETVILPDDWRSRLIVIVNENTRGASGLCLHPEDLAVSKLIAGREKDIGYLKGMLRYRMIRTAAILNLLSKVSRLEENQKVIVAQRLARLIAELVSEISTGGGAQES